MQTKLLRQQNIINSNFILPISIYYELDLVFTRFTKDFFKEFLKKICHIYKNEMALSVIREIKIILRKDFGLSFMGFDGEMIVINYDKIVSMYQERSDKKVIDILEYNFDHEIIHVLRDNKVRFVSNLKRMEYHYLKIAKQEQKKFNKINLSGNETESHELYFNRLIENYKFILIYYSKLTIEEGIAKALSLIRKNAIGISHTLDSRIFNDRFKEYKGSIKKINNNNNTIFSKLLDYRNKILTKKAGNLLDYSDFFSKAIKKQQYVMKQKGYSIGLFIVLTLISKFPNYPELPMYSFKEIINSPNVKIYDLFEHKIDHMNTHRSFRFTDLRKKYFLISHRDRRDETFSIKRETLRLHKMKL